MYFSIKQQLPSAVVAVALTLGQYGVVNTITSKEVILSIYQPLLHVEETTVLYTKEFDTTTEFKVLAQTNAYALDTYIPKTELGKKLLEYRRQAVEAGLELMSADEIAQIMKELRGDSNYLT